jgi:hypothetical protein
VRVVAVGDPKQSIYLFRNARVEVFLRARAAAEEVRALSRTHRHAKQVVELLNRFTARFFSGPRRGTGWRGCGRRRAGWRCTGFWGSWRRPEGAEARLLAQRLLALRAEGIPFGEMAVLVRGPAPASPPWKRPLGRRGSPSCGGGGRASSPGPRCGTSTTPLRLALAERPYALEDRLSLLAFLRSPFLGLDLSELEEALRAEEPLAPPAQGGAGGPGGAKGPGPPSPFGGPKAPGPGRGLFAADLQTGPGPTWTPCSSWPRGRASPPWRTSSCGSRFGPRTRSPWSSPRAEGG